MQYLDQEMQLLLQVVFDPSEAEMELFQNNLDANVLVLLHNKKMNDPCLL